MVRPTDWPPTGFIGAGRLGWALATALARRGWPVVACASQQGESARRLAAAIPGCVATTATGVVERSRLVVLAVPDRAIAPLATALPWQPGQGVVHLSGALGLEVLAPVRARGGAVGRLHPLLSAPPVGSADDPFAGIFCAVEAEPALQPALADLVQTLGAHLLRLPALDATGRALYHVAAVLVGNYSLTLLALASDLLARLGLPPATARPALLGLWRSVLRNLEQVPPEAALTGPVARGDVATVAQHLAALGQTDPTLARLYALLGQATLGLVWSRLPATARTALAARLAEAPQDPWPNVDQKGEGHADHDRDSARVQAARREDHDGHGL